MRCGGESNPCIAVLQTAALPLRHRTTRFHIVPHQLFIHKLMDEWLILLSMTSHFTSPTYGELSVEELKSTISKYMETDKAGKYEIVIGTDSKKSKTDGYDFVTVFVIHHLGHGGIYFWNRSQVVQKMSLKERIYREALMSLQSSEDFISLFKTNGISRQNVQIHVDIGPRGETRTMIQEIVGMVRSNGYDVKTKPYAFGASNVADRHT